MRMLGERLREARVASGLSQAQLGAPYFTRAHVSAIELGKIRPAMRSLEHLARKLGKSPSYFLDDVDAERGRKERELELTAIAGLLTFAEAAEALRRIEKIADGEGLTVRETCRLRLYEGTALDLLHRGRDAIKALTVAQRLARELRDPALERAATYQLAVATRVAGNAREARAMLEELVRRLETAKPPDELLRLRALITIGDRAPRRPWLPRRSVGRKPTAQSPARPSCSRSSTCATATRAGPSAACAKRSRYIKRRKPRPSWGTRTCDSRERRRNAATFGVPSATHRSRTPRRNR